MLGARLISRDSVFFYNVSGQKVPVASRFFGSEAAKNGVPMLRDEYLGGKRNDANGNLRKDTS